MTKTHELDRDRDLDDARTKTDAGVAPGRTTRTQDLVGPTGARPSGIVMRKARDANGVQEGAETAVAAASTSGGHALPDPVREKFEGSLGADLSHVRVHDGAESAASADAVGAKAYTLGSDIHFGAGQFDPSSPAGEHLLAHEVAHTVQQTGGAVARVAQFKLDVSSPNDAYEAEADRAADAMVHGAPASVSGANGLARAVMRKEEPSAKEGSKGGTRKDALVRSYSWPMPEKNLKYFKISGSLGAELAGTLEHPAEKAEGGDAKLSKTSDGRKKGVEIEHEVPITKWESKADEKVKETAEKDMVDGFEITEIELVGVANAGAESSEKAVNLSLTAKAKMRNGMSAELSFAVAKYKGESLTNKELQFGCLKLTVATPEKQLPKLELGDKCSVTGSIKFTASLEASPNWEEILKWVAQEAIKDGEVAGLEALGTVAGLAAGFVLVGASMVFAGIMDSRETAEVEAAVAEGQRKIELYVAASLDGYGLGGAVSDNEHTDSIAATAYGLAWKQVVAATNKALQDPKAKGVKADLNDPQFRALVTDAIIAKNGRATLDAAVRRSAIAFVSRQMAQKYYNANKGSWHTDQHVRVEAEKICLRLGGDASWQPTES